MKKIISIILLLAMVLTFASCAKKDEGELMQPENPYKAEDIVMKSENFSFTRAELSVIFFQYCNEYFSDSQIIDFYNIDVESSLKDQFHGDVSWFSEFANQSVEYMKSVLVLCEGAKAAGVSLSEEDKAAIDEVVNTYVRFAADYGYTEAEYFSLRFGKDSNRNALRDYLTKDALATKYEDIILNENEYTDEDLSAYVEAHPDYFETINYIYYTFDEDCDSSAKESAEALAAITDPAEFDSYIISYMTDVLRYSEANITTKDCYRNYKYYDETSEFSKWAFDGAAAGTTYTKTNNTDGQYTVYLLTSAAAVREDISKDIRVVTVSMSSHETENRALLHTEEIKIEWLEGEATEESFIELVNSHSDDSSANENGGLIKGIAIGDNLPEGMEEWLWSSETTAGSVEIFKDTGSFFLVYFKGDGELTWKMDARSGLTGEHYDKVKGDLEKTHKVEQFDEVINSLEA